MIGAFVFVLGAIFLVHTSRGGVGALDDGIRLSAVYQSVDGVAEGTDILLGGIPVGKVTRVDYVPSGHRARLTLWIRDDVALPADSVAMIVSQGMLGGKYIKLEPGGDMRTLQDGDQFDYVQDAVIFEELLQKVVLDAEARREDAAQGSGNKGAPADKPNPFGSLLR